MTLVRVVYDDSAVNQKQYVVNWTPRDLERLIQSIKGTRLATDDGWPITINCSTQDAYMIMTRFLMAPKVIS